MKILIIFFLSVSFSFAKPVFFQGGSMSLQELTIITSNEIHTPILLSSSLINNKVYLMVNRNVDSNQIFNYYKTLLNANGFKLIKKDSFFIVAKTSDREFYSYRFKYRTSLEFKPFLKSIKKICSLGSNVLICNAVPKEISLVKKTVNVFDVPLPLDKFKDTTVSIHLKVVESSYNKLLKLSNKLSSNIDTNNYKGSMISDNGSLSLVSNLLLNGSSIVNNLSLNYLFDFLKSNEISHVLSEPNVLVTNNHQTTIISGTNRKVIASVTESRNIEGQTTTQYTDLLSGLTLTVKVKILNDKKVLIDLSLDNGNVIGGTSLLPVTSEQNYKTSLVVDKNSSIVIGGLVFTKKTKIESKVPILGDIPILGFPFRSKDNRNEKHVLSLILSVKDFL